MPNPERIAIDTGPLIAIVAGLGTLDLLRELYKEVVVPLEVAEEIAALQSSRFVQPEFDRATWLTNRSTRVQVRPEIGSSLDRGEAAVIQTALDMNIATVCIDEAAGRRAAQRCGLLVTGSLGMLIRAKREAKLGKLRPILDRMRAHGVWLGQDITAVALALAGE